MRVWLTCSVVAWEIRIPRMVVLLLIGAILGGLAEIYQVAGCVGLADGWRFTVITRRRGGWRLRRLGWRRR